MVLYCYEATRSGRAQVRLCMPPRVDVGSGAPIWAGGWGGGLTGGWDGSAVIWWSLVFGEHKCAAVVGRHSTRGCAPCGGTRLRGAWMEARGMKVPMATKRRHTWANMPCRCSGLGVWLCLWRTVFREWGVACACIDRHEPLILDSSQNGVVIRKLAVCLSKLRAATYVRYTSAILVLTLVFIMSVGASCYLARPDNLYHGRSVA